MSITTFLSVKIGIYEESELRNDVVTAYGHLKGLVWARRPKNVDFFEKRVVSKKSIIDRAKTFFAEVISSWKFSNFLVRHKQAF